MERRLFSIEGNRQKLDGGAMFGNAPRALWERWASPDDRHRIDLSCRALLIREPDRNILLETGIGAFFEPKSKDRFGIQESHHVLLENLEAVGTPHQDIDIVILSHLHFDHAGGLLSQWEEDKPMELLFPSATFVTSHDAWERACHPHRRDRASFIPELQVLLEASGRLELLDDETTSNILGPDYRFHYSHGHTPGLLLTELAGSGGPILFGGDLIPGRPWVHQSITMGYDRYPELLIDEKTERLTDLVERHGRVFFTHDPTCAIARITRDERGRFGSSRNRAALVDEIA